MPDKVTLRPISTEDAPFILTLYNTPKFYQFIGDKGLRTVTDARQYIEENMLPLFVQYQTGTYIISLQENGEAVGTVGLYNRAGIDGFDLGFALLPAYERKGIMFTACQLLLDQLKTELRLEHLSAVTRTNNQASQGLLKKLGFVEKGNIKLPQDNNVSRLFTLSLD